MSEKFANAASTTLNGAIDASQTTLVVTSAALFPLSGTFRLIIGSELFIVTGVSGTTFTVTRGAESSVAATHASGVAVTCIITAGALTQMVADAAGDDGIGSLDNATTGTQNDVVTTIAGVAVKYMRFTGAAPTVTGFASGVGQRYLVAMAIGGSLVAGDEQAGSVAANRITTGISGPLTIPAGSAGAFAYDSTASRWRYVGKARMKLTGDASGNTDTVSVDKIKGTAITTSGGSLAVGAVLRTTAAGTADWGTVDLADADARTGTLPVGNGGTGLTAPGTSGNVLTSNGSAWTSAAPAGGGASSVGTSGALNASDGAGGFVDTSWIATSTYIGAPGILPSSGNLRLPSGFISAFVVGGVDRGFFELTSGAEIIFGDFTGIAGIYNRLSAGDWRVQIAGSNYLIVSTSKIESPGPIAIGALPATTGDLRLDNEGAIRYRNAADNQNLELIRGVSNDSVYIGTPGGGTNNVIPWGDGYFISKCNSGFLAGNGAGVNWCGVDSANAQFTVPVRGGTGLVTASTLQMAVGVINSTSITTFTASNDQYSCPVIQHTSSAGSGTAVWNFPATLGTCYLVDNQDIATNVTIKVSGLTGVTIAAGCRATIYCNGTDYVRVTNDVV